MRIRDKIITAACLTKEGIEWTSLKTKQGKTERTEQGTLPFSDEHREGTTMATVHLPDEVAGKLEGDITASIRTSELIMRTMEFPSADPEEIASMVNFQIDRISPFPMDQLAVSHEILKTTDSGAMVLMAAAKRGCIDAIGETFKQRGITIHSIDARILGWLKLLKDEQQLPETGCQVLIVEDGVDFAMTILLDGVPLSIHALSASTEQSEEFARNLAEEISYTLIALDTEHALSTPESIEFWSLEEKPNQILYSLQKITGIPVHQHTLNQLPPLSVGIAKRARKKTDRMELIPREWIEHKKSTLLKKRMILGASVVACIWIAGLAVAFTLFKIRNDAYTKLHQEEQRYASRAMVALQNKQKLQRLKAHMDRSNSALECLLEATVSLPNGEIEFSSFRYDKNKSEVQLRGVAESGSTVDDYFIALTHSELFENLENQNSTTRTIRGARRSQYSVTLPLSGKEGK